MSSEGKIAVIGLIAIASWTFVALPLIYLYQPSEPTTVIKTVISLLTPSVAFAALLVAWRQLYLNRQNQRETTAKSIFREFLTLCIEYPDLANGHPTDSTNQAKYEWFVHQFLWAAEELLEFDERTWRDNLRLHVAYHQQFLQTNQEFLSKDLPTYKCKLRTFLKWALASLPATNGSEASGHPNS